MTYEYHPLTVGELKRFLEEEPDLYDDTQIRIGYEGGCEGPVSRIYKDTEENTIVFIE